MKREKKEWKIKIRERKGGRVRRKGESEGKKEEFLISSENIQQFFDSALDFIGKNNNNNKNKEKIKKIKKEKKGRIVEWESEREKEWEERGKSEGRKRGVFDFVGKYSTILRSRAGFL